MATLLYNGDPYTRKDSLYIEMWPSFVSGKTSLIIKHAGILVNIAQRNYLTSIAFSLCVFKMI